MSTRLSNYAAFNQLSQRSRSPWRIAAGWAAVLLASGLLAGCPKPQQSGGRGKEKSVLPVTIHLPAPASTPT